MPFPSLSHPLLQHPEILSTTIEGKTVLMSVSHGQYFSLDEISSDIWARLAEPQTAEDIINQMLENYDGPASTITEETLTLLEDLYNRHLLVDAR